MSLPIPELLKKAKKGELSENEAIYLRDRDQLPDGAYEFDEEDDELEEMDKDELLERAAALDIKGRNNMRKAELKSAIETAEQAARNAEQTGKPA